MKEIQGKVKMIAIPVPIDAGNIVLIHGGTRVAYFEPNYKRFDIPKNQYNIVGKFSELTEDQFRELVETIFLEIAPSPSNDMSGGFDIQYVDYENRGEYAGWNGDAGCYKKAKDSFISLLKSNDCLIKEWAIEPNPIDFDVFGLFDAADRFDEAVKKFENTPEDYLILKQRINEVFQEEIG
jgi:hypothetical protein